MTPLHIFENVLAAGFGVLVVLVIAACIGLPIYGYFRTIAHGKGE